MAELQEWPHRNLTVPYKCDQLWQVATEESDFSLQLRSTVAGGRITGVANFTRCCVPDSRSDYATQQCEWTMPDCSVYQYAGTLICWTRDEIAVICLRVPFQNLLVSQKCLSGICHRLGFEEISSWMRISNNTAMIITCRLATQTNGAARAYGIAIYVSLSDWCGRSLGLTVSIAG